MTPIKLLRTAIIPAAIELAPHGIPDSRASRRMLLAIALQESRIEHRRQVSADGSESGPAVSFWQFEKGGGCKGVLAHSKVGPMMRTVCASFNVTPGAAELWEAMRYQDIVAACAARLLLYTLPDALPETPAVGWMQYINAWRPGKPHHENWLHNWALADSIVRTAE